MKSIARCAAFCCAVMLASLGAVQAQLIYPLSDLNLDLSQIDFTYASAGQSYST